jgi:cytochrome c-type biogenesis protein CcmF
MGALSRLKIAGAVTAVAVVLCAALTWGRPVLGAIAMGFAVWLTAGVLTEVAERIRLGRITLRQSMSRAAGLPRSAWGMTLAHLGIAGIIAGAAGATLWQQEIIRVMQPNQTMEIAGFSLTFDGKTANSC